MAALAVVFSHAGERLDGSFHIGAAGVDLFFVISGFIMWAVAGPSSGHAGAFLLHRVIRIVPTYWAVTLGLVALALLRPGLLPNFDTGAGNVLLSLGFVPHFDAQGKIYPVLAVGWTLVFEMLFYLIFAAVFGLSPRHRLAALAATLCGLVLAGLILRPVTAIGLTLTDPILLEFLAGLLIGEAWSRRRLPQAGLGWGLLAAGVLALLAQALAGAEDAAPRVLAWGGPAACIVLGCLAIEAHRGVPDLAVPRAIGDASYSIYLIHGPLVGPVLRLTTGWPPALFFMLVVGISVLAGLLCFRLFERRATRLLRSLSRSMGRRPGRIAIRTVR